MIIDFIFGLHIMSVALVTFGIGALVIGGRWIRCKQLDIPFPRFPKLLFLLGVLSFGICALFFAGIQRLILQYIFSLTGIIYLISVLWIQRKGKL